MQHLVINDIMYMEFVLITYYIMLFKVSADMK